MVDKNYQEFLEERGRSKPKKEFDPVPFLKKSLYIVFFLGVAAFIYFGGGDFFTEVSDPATAALNNSSSEDDHFFSVSNLTGMLSDSEPETQEATEVVTTTIICMDNLCISSGDEINATITLQRQEEEPVSGGGPTEVAEGLIGEEKDLFSIILGNPIYLIAIIGGVFAFRSFTRGRSRYR